MYPETLCGSSVVINIGARPEPYYEGGYCSCVMSKKSFKTVTYSTFAVHDVCDITQRV